MVGHQTTSTTSSSSSILISLIILLFLFITHIHVAESSPTSSCRSHTLLGQESNNSRNTAVHTALECKSIKTLDESQVIAKTFSNYISYKYFLDTRHVEVCGSLNYLDLLLRLNVSSCEEYFCDSEKALSGEQLQVSDHSRMRNFCQYCTRLDFLQFHTRVVNGSCPNFHFPSKSFCKNKLNRSQASYPLVFAGVAKKHKEPYICSCDESNRFGYRCDSYSLFLMPLTQVTQPILIVCVCGILFLCILLALLAPSIIAKVSDLIKNRDDYRNRIKNFICLRDFMSISMCLHLLFLGLEAIFAIPTVGIYVTRGEFGEGMFRATSLLCLFISMFTLFTNWLKILYQADNLGRSGIPKPLAVILAFIYLVFFSLVTIPIASIAPSVRKKQVLNHTFFPLVLACVILFALCFIIYGMKLFYRVRMSNRLTIFELKFTRFMLVQAFLLFCIAIEMLFIIIEFNKPGGPHFGISYRIINFPLLDWTVLFVIIAMMYQLFSYDKLIEGYPCLDSLCQMMKPSNWRRKFREQRRRQEDREMGYRKLEDMTTL